MDTSVLSGPSNLFHQASESAADSFAILHLRRNDQLPLILRTRDDDNEGYSEGKVVNTRFGSFPHSTLIGVPFGAQVRASKVDTGSRGRRAASKNQSSGQKRKRGPDTPDAPSTEEVDENDTPKAATAADSGFGHLLPPTPERWTSSLTHRTQVVYIPDYSYILQRLRARPGSVIIEAGGGSGSFTHAAARAAFNGYPDDTGSSPKGHVWTFEFDEERARRILTDLHDHQLESTVTLTQRDVYSDGFNVLCSDGTNGVQANIIFLDLPAPWRAIPHLDRSLASTPLDPLRAAHLCVFSPCIEQVQRTVALLRARGWVEVSVQELAARRLEVRRERVGLQEEGLRGAIAQPASVDEAVARLRELEARQLLYQTDWERDLSTKQDRLRDIRNAQAHRKLYSEGRLVHRSEADLKTHTSYLVFAVLPRAWIPEQEQQAELATPSLSAGVAFKSKKQMKREAKAERVQARAAAAAAAAAVAAKSTAEVKGT